MNPLVRPSIAKLEGYVPGEQPKTANIIKLNTNENPYPPSPAVGKALAEADYELLRLYPDPVGQTLREEIGAFHGLSADQVLLTNGSDDVLTIVSRSFLDETHPAAFPVPTYSLYQTLADLQNAPVKTVALDAEHDFAFPDDFEEKIEGASLLFIARPNAPTGNLYSMERMEKLCSTFKGAILFDEAYADFSGSSCVELMKRHPNVCVSRTFSKSRSLAGLRFGYLLAEKTLINEFMKVKDSYNVSRLAQTLALASFRDRDYLKETTEKIIRTRDSFAEKMRRLSFRVIDSSTNFVFVSPPPEKNAKEYFDFLRTKNIIVRYFPASLTKDFVRITIGLPGQMEKLLAETEIFLKMH